MRRYLPTIGFLAGVAMFFGGIVGMALEPAPPPPPIPLIGANSPQQVGAGEGLSTFARRLCNADFTNYYHAVQQMNPWFTVGLQPGTVLAVPSCPVVYSRPDSPTTTTTVGPSTTTTSTSTSTTSTTSSTVVATTSSSTVAPTSTSTTTPGVCSGAPGTPGSADGHGGCFPGAGTVGVPAGVTLTPYTGSCTISTANVTIDAKDFSNCKFNGLLIRANNVTITRSKIYNSVHGVEGSGAAFTISDSLIDGAMTNGYACINCGVDGWNFTLTRVEIIHTNRGAWCMKTCLIQDSWIHAVNLQPIVSNEAHASAIRVEQNSTLIHNTIHCDYGVAPTDSFPNAEIGCSADMSGYADFAAIMHNTMTNNLFRANPRGAGFCAYGGNTNKPPPGHSDDAGNGTFIVFTDNVFERGTGIGAQGGLKICGTYGAITDFASGKTGDVWAGNVWDTGGMVLPG